MLRLTSLLSLCRGMGVGEVPWVMERQGGFCAVALGAFEWDSVALGKFGVFHPSYLFLALCSL